MCLCECVIKSFFFFFMTGPTGISSLSCGISLFELYVVIEINLN